MKKLFITLIGVLTIGVTLPSVAGGDVQSDQLWNREQARRAKLAQIAKEGAPQTQAPQGTASTNVPQSDTVVQREKMMKECTEMVKKRD